MTTLEAFAELHKMTLKNLKGMCQLILEHVPTELSEEQVAILEARLLEAASDSLPPEQKALVQAAPQELDPFEKRLIQQAIGAEELELQAVKLFKGHEARLLKMKYIFDCMQFQKEQEIYASYGEMCGRVSRNLDSALDKAIPKGILAQFGDALRETFYPD